MEGGIRCRVNFIWDNESQVWIATSKDVEGLVLEDSSLDNLFIRVRDAIPELLELNNRPTNIIDYSFIAERTDRTVVYS